MYQEFLDEGKGRMAGAVKSLEGDLAGYSTGRANPAILDKIQVEAYGVKIPLKQIASVSAPEPQQLAVRPFDATSVPDIERAILEANLGLNPNNDGAIIYLNVPRLTEERRRELSKMVGKRVEEGKVAVRNVRRDVLGDLRDLKDEKMLTEDEFHEAQEALQEMTDKFVKKLDDRGKMKSEEIMAV